MPYEIQPIRFEDIKKKPFADVNPNGRVPGISPLYNIYFPSAFQHSLAARALIDDWLTGEK